MKQEDLNEMMRFPGEVARAAKTKLLLCPTCCESYCGDGVEVCTECAAEYNRAQKEDARRSEGHDEMRRDAFGA
jgi:hypothetical protein